MTTRLVALVMFLGACGEAAVPEVDQDAGPHPPTDAGPLPDAGDHGLCEGWAHSLLDCCSWKTEQMPYCIYYADQNNYPASAGTCCASVPECANPQPGACM